jgi:hypothetical protein
VTPSNTPTDIPTNTPTATVIATETPSPTATLIPFPVDRFISPEANFGFEYIEGSALAENEQGVVIETAVDVATGESVLGTVRIARGTPEELIGSEVICDRNSPFAALGCIDPEGIIQATTLFDRQAWLLTQESVSLEAGRIREDIYIVVIEDEWFFIRTTAQVDQFEQADVLIFKPLLGSLFILDPDEDLNDGITPTPRPIFGYGGN